MIQVIANPEPLPESASLSEAVTWNFGQWPPIQSKTANGNLHRATGSLA
jgi:hypothetical protein